jgi:hypothetical protein
MSAPRKKLKPAEKAAIVDEAGNKCANPGCSNWRVHIHHIKHWAIYESNDQSILIAVCPSCHDAIHHGHLNITDETLYAWKGIKRSPKPKTTHIYVEPSENIKLLTGSIALSSTNESATIFELSENNKLSFRVLDGDINLLNIAISDIHGNDVLKVKDNYIKILDDNLVSFEQVPGHVCISTSHAEDFIPTRFLNIMREEQPDYANMNNAILLELEVLKPGLVRVKGCWADNKVAVIITDSSLSFIHDGLQRPLSMIGDGEESVLMFAGTVTSAMFGFK